jgi:hypothetical protein
MCAVYMLLCGRMNLSTIITFFYFLRIQAHKVDNPTRSSTQFEVLKIRAHFAVSGVQLVLNSGALLLLKTEPGNHIVRVGE